MYLGSREKGSRIKYADQVKCNQSKAWLGILPGSEA